MGRGQSLSECEMGQIDALLKLDKSHRDIAKLISRSKTAVTNYVTRKGKLSKSKPLGRPKKLTARGERVLINVFGKEKSTARAVMIK